MQNTFEIKVKKIAHDGAGEAEHEGKPVRIHGMLPGEEGIVDAHKKHGIYVGILKELIKASTSRKTPEELHYLSCGPWQVMEYPLQVELKHKMISELFSYYDEAPEVGFTGAIQFYGYRTKVEFSFCDREGDNAIPLSLAFHERGGGSRRLALPEGCALASENMNRAALAICERLREQGYVARDLKTLIIRESKSDERLIALLFAKKDVVNEFRVDDIPNLSGFIAFHSTEKSPASVPTKELWRYGDDHLTEIIDGISVRYSWDSFFQNNIPVFKEAVAMMAKNVNAGDSITELYAGAGTIGLLLSRKVKKIKGVEIIDAAVLAANMNAKVNAIGNYEAVAVAAEAIDSEFLDGNILLLDPPRAGLHPKLLLKIREKLPPKIIYLSCNPETQARDYSTLADLYKLDKIHGFDFYPQTPHVENLIILSLRNK